MPYASHFRFGHTTWSRVSDNPDGSVTVEFTTVQAWRASFLDMLATDPGDGTGGISGPITDIGTFTDIGGESYTIRTYSVQHTYSAATSQLTAAYLQLSAQVVVVLAR